MQIDVAKASNFIKEDANGAKKFLIGCLTLLFSFLLLPALCAMGYGLEATREASEEAETAMPEWNRWAEFMYRGFCLLIITLVILSIPIALNVFGTWRVFYTAMSTSRADAALNGTEVSTFGPLCIKISMVLGALLSYVLPAASLRYARSLKIVDGFAFGGIVEDIKKAPADYTAAWAIPTVIFVFSNLLMGLPLPAKLGYILSVPVSFFAMVLGGKLMGQYHKLYLSDNP